MRPKHTQTEGNQPVEGLPFIAHSMHRILATSFPSSDSTDAAAQSSATLE